jgi:hypothetical protein
MVRCSSLRRVAVPATPELFIELSCTTHCCSAISAAGEAMAVVGEPVGALVGLGPVVQGEVPPQPATNRLNRKWSRVPKDATVVSVSGSHHSSYNHASGHPLTSSR